MCAHHFVEIDSFFKQLFRVPFSPKIANDLFVMSDYLRENFPVNVPFYIVRPHKVYNESRYLLS